MRGLLIFLSGAQPDLLEHIKADRPKYEGVGFAILFTGVIAGISMYFALHTALNVTFVLAVIGGIGWAFLIMGIDRMLVVSLTGGPAVRNFFLVMLPRLLLGLLISVVISTPIILQLFRPEIEQQIGALHQQQLSNYYKTEKSGALAQKIAKLEKEIAGLIGERNQPAGLAKLTAEYQADKNKAAGYFAEYQCQISGLPGCVAGDGPRAMRALKYFNTYTSDANQVNAEIQTLRSHFGATSGDLQGQIKADQGQLKQALDQQAAAAAAAARAISADRGLLIRLQALGRATAHDSTLQITRWLLFLLFVVIECMPVLSKILLVVGEPNTYEQALKYDSTKQLDVAKKMSDDKIGEADSVIAERSRTRAQTAKETVAQEQWARQPMLDRWRQRLGGRRRRMPSAVNGSGYRPARGARAWVPRDPPRPPARHRHRKLAGWPAWAAGPEAKAGADLPPIFLRDPAAGNGQSNGAGS